MSTQSLAENDQNINITVSIGDAILLYNLLHLVIRRNREDFDDTELEFLGDIKKKLSDAVQEHDSSVANMSCGPRGKTENE